MASAAVKANKTLIMGSKMSEIHKNINFNRRVAKTIEHLRFRSIGDFFNAAHFISNFFHPDYVLAMQLIHAR